ncbi:unnamed protein product [Dovyalis caffra]|uniref:Uncharacterized protein n=1 Tax=Dovyalis caffra TaxID=77055 RepID=A0AAV1R9P3_9ROSI|nr:unnamed protein product [Dovyalis caffra]
MVKAQQLNPPASKSSDRWNACMEKSLVKNQRVGQRQCMPVAVSKDRSRDKPHKVHFRNGLSLHNDLKELPKKNKEFETVK